MENTQPTIQKLNFETFGKTSKKKKKKKKKAVEHSIEGSNLLNFLNLSTTICPRLSEEAFFHFQISPDPMILHFLKSLVFQKIH